MQFPYYNLKTYDISKVTISKLINEWIWMLVYGHYKNWFKWVLVQIFNSKLRMLCWLFHVYNPNIKISIFEFQNSKCEISKIDSTESNINDPYYSVEWRLFRCSNSNHFKCALIQWYVYHAGGFKSMMSNIVQFQSFLCCWYNFVDIWLIDWYDHSEWCCIMSWFGLIDSLLTFNIFTKSM